MEDYTTELEKLLVRALPYVAQGADNWTDQKELLEDLKIFIDAIELES